MVDEDNGDVGDGAYSGAGGDRGAKRRIVIMLLLYSLLLGMAFGLASEGRLANEFLLGLPILALSVWWCSVDARERGYRIGRPTRVILVLCLMVGLPLYLFQTRGMRGCISLALVLLLGAAMFACVVAAFALTLWVRQAVEV